MAAKSKRRMLWGCSRFPGGTHFYASVGLLNPDGEGYEWRKDRPKVANAERALMWIEREFKLLTNTELFDYMEQREGLKAMRAFIRDLKEQS